MALKTNWSCQSSRLPPSDSRALLQMIARAPYLVAALLVGLIGVRGAFLFGWLEGAPATPSLPSVPNLSPTPAAVDVSLLLRANIFGRSIPVSDSSNATVTTMPLTLAGVIAAFDSGRALLPKLGWAMIGSSAADITLCRVGTAVPGGAILHEVHADRVFLDRNGTIEVLIMPPKPGMPAMLSAARSPASGASPVQRAQQVMRDNPDVLTRIMSYTPVIAGNGKFRGIRLSPAPNQGVFVSIGLKPGELVTAINGVQLIDQASVESALKALAASTESQITVMRRGAKQDLRLNMAKAADAMEELSR
jgi:general secretion pathway protein C